MRENEIARSSDSTTMPILSILSNLFFVVSLVLCGLDIIIWLFWVNEYQDKGSCYLQNEVGTNVGSNRNTYCL
jgi:hypothetical protein